MLQHDQLLIDEYDYNLPDSKIAKYPVAKRDNSKLLIFNGDIKNAIFSEIDKFIPNNSLIIFNNTRVIKARLLFKKNTGASIEIFCLQPENQYYENKQKCRWRCLVGNSKRWNNGKIEKKVVINNEEIIVLAEKIDRVNDSFIIEFSWNNSNFTFFQLLEQIGKVPLPPYINREVEDTDTERYQTIYAINDGSVAAPTAGLHFTNNVIENLKSKFCKIAYITLHVGAGTFKPVTEVNVAKHIMHYEEIIFDKNTIEKILKNLSNYIIPVGTTSMRSIESLYYIGCQIINEDFESEGFFVKQWEAYNNNAISVSESLNAIINYMNINELNSISGRTQIMIAPGYEFKICKALITNFHQPKSTLLLLVSAFIGNKWKDVYSYALNNDFRFLSYGDSCLLFLSL